MSELSTLQLRVPETAEEWRAEAIAKLVAEPSYVLADRYGHSRNQEFLSLVQNLSGKNRGAAYEAAANLIWEDWWKTDAEWSVFQRYFLEALAPFQKDELDELYGCLTVERMPRPFVSRGRFLTFLSKHGLRIDWESFSKSGTRAMLERESPIGIVEALLYAGALETAERLLKRAFERGSIHVEELRTFGALWLSMFEKKEFPSSPCGMSEEMFKDFIENLIGEKLLVA